MICAGILYLSGAYGYMGITATAGNVIGVARDSVAGKIWFSKTTIGCPAIRRAELAHNTIAPNFKLNCIQR